MLFTMNQTTLWEFSVTRRDNSPRRKPPGRWTIHVAWTCWRIGWKPQSQKVPKNKTPHLSTFHKTFHKTLITIFLLGDSIRNYRKKSWQWRGWDTWKQKEQIQLEWDQPGDSAGFIDLEAPYIHISPAFFIK